MPKLNNGCGGMRHVRDSIRHGRDSWRNGLSFLMNLHVRMPMLSKEFFHHPIIRHSGMNNITEL